MNEIDRKFIKKLKSCSADDLIELKKSTKLGNRLVGTTGVAILFITLHFPIVTIISAFLVYIVANISVYMSHVIGMIDAEINRRINT